MIIFLCLLQDPFIEDNDDDSNTCRFIQMQCNYRSGCGATLQVHDCFINDVSRYMLYVDQIVLLLLPKYIFKFQSFIFECDNLLKNRTAVCTDRCKNTLIGLTSTVEGRKLMNVSIL